MQCPLHQVSLLKSEKHGVEIDYCPHCGGAWFERGELDKLVDIYGEVRSRAWAAYEAERQQPRAKRPVARSKSRRKSAHRKVKDFLEDIFDFD